MDKRATSGRSEPIPSILKKPKSRHKGDLFDKSNKIRGEKVEGATKKGEGASAGPSLPQGCTPLMYACQQADYKTVVELINKDETSVQARDRSLRTALHYCASSGGVSQVSRANCADRLLMAAPGLTEARDVDGLTPLHLAVVHGNVPLVQTLLAAGADVNATDDEQHTVVHWATVCGEVGALRAVLAAGAAAEAPDQRGGYPLHYAAQMCGPPAAAVSQHQQSRGAALEVVRALLLEGGAQPGVRDADGRTPLLWAASAGAAAALLQLHQHGANVDDADRDGLTGVHCAAARGHTEALETLVALCGAGADAADAHGCTPLHYAAALGHADATQALLQLGADADRQDRRGRSAAHTASSKGQLETVRMLGAKGANLWLRNSKGDLPLHEAVASGRRELVRWLLDGRPSQVNATNHDGRTPLHIAAATDNADLCKLLLDRGAEVNLVARSSKNEPITPLDCAIARGHRSTAKYLQVHGGLPASKLMNTQILIDGATVTSLPSRKVTSTKIDVRDRIRIEQQIVEVSSPFYDSRYRDHQYLGSDASSDDEKRRRSDRRSPKKHSKKQTSRRKKVFEQQRSFSDGYDSDLDGMNKADRIVAERKHSKGLKKSRSRSEPSRRNDRGKHPRNRSESRSSSEISINAEKKKKHRRHSRRKSDSYSESSTSESSDRRTTKRKGKKTSIHIENDEDKQRVNIVNYKGDDSLQSTVNIERTSSETKTIQDQTEKFIEMEKDDLANNKPLSNTETDTVSANNNTIITEAQVHTDKVTNKNKSADVTVTVDSANNVSIDTGNVTVTHKDVTNQKSLDLEADADNNKKEIIIQSSDLPIPENNEQIVVPQENSRTNDDTTVENVQVQSDPTKGQPTVKETRQNIDNSQQENIEKSSENDLQSRMNLDTAKNEKNSSELIIPEPKRKRSFEVLSGPEDPNAPQKLQGEDTITKRDSADKNMAVSFSNKDEVFRSVDSEKSPHHLMGDQVDHNERSATDIEDTTNKAFDSSTVISSSEEKNKELHSTAGSSSDIPQNENRALVSVLDSTHPTDLRLINLPSSNNVLVPSTQSSPKKAIKTPRSNEASSRKSSFYETESYKVLTDISSTTEVSSGILKKRFSHQDSLYDRSGEMLEKDMLGRVPSVSDNEIYNRSEMNGRRKRLRKKSRGKSRTAIHSKSEHSERGYESSGMMDSGFEPSPRVVHRRIKSPRLAAYYQQRNASGKHSGKSDSRIPVRKPGDKNAVDMKSVTQKIQTNMRRYYCERKIFQHLLELKRLQIRTSKTNEGILVKRAIEEYNKSSLAHVGLGPYNIPDYSFSSFEKFLYESLRKLQKSGKKHLDSLPEKPIDFDYGESELYQRSAIPDNPCLCTQKTHRCFHAIHAYTGVPCSAYIPFKLNHHTMPKPSTAGAVPKSRGFLPNINSKSALTKPHVTLEVAHGADRKLIALPAEKLDKNKRYYVTFTVKGSEPASDDNASTKNAKSD